MPVKPVPDHYHGVQPYLMFQNARTAMEFYRRAFGALERLCMANVDGRVGHMEMEIGDCVLMMADESPAIEAWSIQHYGGSPVSFVIYTEDCDAMYRRAVEAGATGFRKPEDQPYGDRMAGVKDPFGYRWFLATHIRDASKEELEAMH